MRRELKAAQEAAGETPKEMATATGISERYYRFIEAGTREDKSMIWDKLEDLLNVPQRQLRVQTL